VPGMARPTGADADLARVIRALREQRSLSQETLAHAAEITTSSFARIERGQANPTWLTVTRIAAALDVTLAELGAAVDGLRAT
jgi:transcriptional regulator with XRE-family HTH domain